MLNSQQATRMFPGLTHLKVIGCFFTLRANSGRIKYSGTSTERSAKGLGKCVRYIEDLLYRTPPFNEFSGKLPKCSLYRDIVND